MLCRLCFGVCDQFSKELLDSSGHNTLVYNIALKYLDELLSGIKEECDKQMCVDTLNFNSHVICTSCWHHIEIFHKWREQLEILQKERLKKFDNPSQLDLVEDVKLEVEMDVDKEYAFADSFGEDISDNGGMFEDATEDPVAICETKVEDYPDTEDNENCNSDSALDDMPLLKRKELEKEKYAINKRERRQKMIKNKMVTSSKHKANDAFIAEYYKEKLPCELCGSLTADFTALHAHFREVHNIDKGYVLCCDRKYSERCHFVDHLQVHLNPKEYQCSKCDILFFSNRTLAKHMKTVHRENPLERRFECEICHKKYAKRSILKSHMETHAEGNPDHICKDCGKGFVLESRLKVHFRNVHSTAYRSVCDQCGKSFRGRSAMKIHMLEHEGGSKRRWSCDQCDLQLYSNYSLKRHKRAAHHDGSKEYVCGECGKVAFTEDALKRHQKYVHQRERVHKCTICDKAFKQAHALKEHMTTHTGEDLYQCPHCPRTFRVNSNLHHHRKRKHPKEWEKNRKQRNMCFKRLDLNTIDETEIKGQK